jgi:hypothetical protein
MSLTMWEPLLTPRMTRWTNLLTWLSIGCGVMLVKRSHWTFEWRPTEDYASDFKATMAMCFPPGRSDQEFISRAQFDYFL